MGDVFPLLAGVGIFSGELQQATVRAVKGVGGHLQTHELHALLNVRQRDARLPPRFGLLLDQAVLIFNVLPVFAGKLPKLLVEVRSDIQVFEVFLLRKSLLQPFHVRSCLLRTQISGGKALLPFLYRLRDLNLTQSAGIVFEFQNLLVKFVKSICAKSIRVVGLESLDFPGTQFRSFTQLLNLGQFFLEVCPGLASRAVELGNLVFEALYRLACVVDG